MGLGVPLAPRCPSLFASPQKGAFAKRCAVGASLRSWGSPQLLRPVGTLGSFPRLRRRGVGLRLAPPASSALCAGLRRAPPSARAGVRLPQAASPKPPLGGGAPAKGGLGEAASFGGRSARRAALLAARQQPRLQQPPAAPHSGGRRGPLIVSPACLAPLCAALPIACRG